MAWPAVCKPTQFGGLGISDLKLQGFALQTRWLWLQKTDQERVWSELPIKTVREVQAFFRASTYTIIGDGRTALFWTDRWIHGEGVQDIAPCLFQLVPMQARRRQSVREALTNRQWVRTITGGFSRTALEEYLALWNILEEFNLNDQPDRLIWRWMDSGRILYSKVGLRDAAHRRYYLPWSPANLVDLGSDEGQDIPLVGASTQALDSGSARTAWSGSKRPMFPL